MRIFIGGLATETNTFAPFPTTVRHFEENGIFRGDASTRGEGLFEIEARLYRGWAEADGHEVVEGLVSFAQPSGRVLRKDYEALRDELIAGVREAGPLDVIFLILHGAMVAEGYDDCEGDIISLCRQACPDAVIGAVLDPHCHLTRAMVELSDLLVPMKLYPHTDGPERAREVYDLCTRTAAGEIAPVAAMLDLSLVAFLPTMDPPMSDLVDEMTAMEGELGLYSVGLAHGFPWADMADVGARVLVYGDSADRAAEAADRVGRRLYDLRAALRADYPDIGHSLERARGLNGRVVLGDFADNCGGGAPGDSTFFLKALIEQKASAAVLGAIIDPQAAQLCADAGVGARLPVRLGGKCGPMSGPPLDVEVEVKAVRPDHHQSFMGATAHLGLSVWVRIEEIDVVVSSARSQVFSPDLFTGLGLTLEDKRIVVVKSSNHYQAGFRPVADHIWHVTSPGAMSLDFANLPYTRRDPNYYPRVEDPWAVAGDPRPEIFAKARRRAAA